MESLEKTAGGIPVFGSGGITLNANFSDSHALYGDSVLTSRVAVAAIYAEEAPFFYTASVGHAATLRLRETVTAAKGRFLISIGDKNYKDFMETHHLPCGEREYVPFIFYCADGTVVNRVCFGLTPDGYGAFVGDVPLNAEMAICSSMTADNMEETIGELFGEIKAKHSDMSGCLVYSCASRIVRVGGMGKELEMIRDKLGDTCFSLAYAGGEIFPQTLKDNQLRNLFQNNSLTICVFE